MWPLTPTSGRGVLRGVGWLYREALVKAGLIVGLFTDFDRHLKQNGYLAMGGQIIDATIVPVPKNRNGREENEAIRSDEMRKAGKAIRPNGDRRIATRAGPRSMAGRTTATRTTSASTGGTNSRAATR